MLSGADSKTLKKHTEMLATQAQKLNDHAQEVEAVKARVDGHTNSIRELMEYRKFVGNHMVLCDERYRRHEEKIELMTATHKGIYQSLKESAEAREIERLEKAKEALNKQRDSENLEKLAYFFTTVEVNSATIINVSKIVVASGAIITAAWHLFDYIKDVTIGMGIW